jgi:hypothetical protein
MSHSLLDTYARLLTTDTHACAELFASDAEFTTHVGPMRLTFRGRDEIRRFLNHVPRQISFRAAHSAPEAGGFSGALRLTAADLQPRQQHVRYAVEGGRFTRFEIHDGRAESGLRAS